MRAKSNDIYSLSASANNTHLPMQQRSNTFIALIIRWSWIALAIAVVFQCVFFSTLPNLIAIISILFGWAIFVKAFLRFDVLSNYPLSTFVIFGFTTTQIYFPLLFTSLEGKPVIFNLELPYQVFFHSFAALIALTLSHIAYRSYQSKKPTTSSGFLSKLSFFTPPTDIQLWLMGFIGLAATFYVYLYSPNIGWKVTGSASDKAIQALMPFSYAPFFIPFGILYGNYEKSTKQLIPLLIGYTLLLFLISIGRNSRAGFMIGFSSVGFAYFLGLLLGVYKARFFTVKNFVIAIGALWLFTGPVADIGTAMVIVRGERHDISYSALISNTLDAYSDKEAIRIRRLYDLDQTEKREWDENYLTNIFLARFCNIKFNDASLVQAEKIWQYDSAMYNFSINYIWAALPQPVLDAFGMTNVDKVMLKGISVGDYLYYVAGGPTEALGGYRTGHFAGTGMATFGWWYLLLLGVGMIPVYFLFDVFFKKIHITSANTLGFQISLCGLVVLDGIFRFLSPSESVVGIATFLVRDWVQLALLYFLIYHFTRLLVFIIPKTSNKYKLSNTRRIARVSKI